MASTPCSLVFPFLLGTRKQKRKTKASGVTTLLQTWRMGKQTPNQNKHTATCLRGIQSALTGTQDRNTTQPIACPTLLPSFLNRLMSQTIHLLVYTHTHTGKEGLYNAQKKKDAPHPRSYTYIHIQYKEDDGVILWWVVLQGWRDL